MSSSDIAAIVGRNIKEARLTAGLTQSQLAARIGATSLMAVSRWENGMHRPSDGFLLKLGEEFGRDFAWFFTEHAPPTPKGHHEQSPPVPARAARVPGAPSASAGSRNLELASERGDTSPVATAPVRPAPPAGAPPGAPDLDHQGAPGPPTGNGAS